MITTELIKNLRERTGAGMLDCKKALVECNGDIDSATDWLREKGIAKAAKKADRIAAEGLTTIAVDGNYALICEINSETDFVAKNEDFKQFVKDAAEMALATEATEIAALLEENHAEGKALKDVLNDRIAKIGVLVELVTEARDEKVLTLGKDIAMQVAAMNPKYVSREDVDPAYIAHETEVLTAQALNEGKPANIVEKMVKGRLEKELKEVCLLEQVFVKDSDLTIKKLVANTAKEVGSDIQVGRVVRFEVGEGIEKKEENFAEEVAKQLK